KQIREILDIRAMPASFDENVSRAVADYTTLEDSLLKKCQNILHFDASERQYINYDAETDMRPLLSSDFKISSSFIIGEYSLSIPIGGNIVFSNQESASECKNVFLNNNDNITNYLRVIQNRLSEKDNARREMLKTKEPQLKPLRESLTR